MTYWKQFLHFNKLEWRFINKTCGLGLFAKQSIQRGEIIGAIPGKEIYCAQNITNAEPIKDALLGYAQFKQQRPDVYGEMELALLLLWQRRFGADIEDQYLFDLPEYVPNTLPMMQNTDHKYNQLIRVFAQALEQDLAPILQFDQEEQSFEQIFRQELSVIGSRAYNLTKFRHRHPNQDLVIDPDINICIFKGADFFNHSNNPNIQVNLVSKSNLYNHDPSIAVVLQAIHDIEPDQELFISYGNHDKQTMLLRYGFYDDDEKKQQREAIQIYE